MIHPARVPLAWAALALLAAALLPAPAALGTPCPVE